MTGFANLCRRLSNRKRLNLLRKVMASPERDGLSAAHLADMTWMSPAAARQHLRVLDAECGLVESVRDGRAVSFRAHFTVDDEGLRRLVSALAVFFRAEGRGGCDVNGAEPPDPAFAKILRPLSDANRGRLLLAIREAGTISKEALRKRSDLSAEDLRRGIQTLTECGLVAVSGKAVSFAEPADSLSRLFVFIALEDAGHGVDAFASGIPSGHPFMI